ncbi:MAG: ribonuclease H family protein [Bacteroidales bacterium]|nr:ribonuclease H family protein [Bacteroidales bacterium]
MAKKQKYYVVWQGNRPGIYESWAECEKQIKGVAGAKYKSYESRTLAEQAFRIGPDLAASVVERQTKGESILTVDDIGMTQVRQDVQGPKPELDAIAVDAACSGNPGVMEYQGVYVASHTQLFHFKAPVGTNNIGEFLAIVHGLAYLKKHNMKQILYSDSVNAINWVRAKQCRTKLALTPDTEKLYDIIRRAEAWLHNNSYSTEIRKWDTDHWGEIPADFGRKG